MTCANRLKLIVQLRRFVVIDEHRRPNLASQCLGLALRELPAEWQRVHDFCPLLVESFHDPAVHQGTLYKVTNWTPLGLTKGFRRHRADFYQDIESPKRLWIRPLQKNARSLLSLPGQLPDEHQKAVAEAITAPAPRRPSPPQTSRRSPAPRRRDHRRASQPKKTALIITAAGGEHFLALKDNQPTLCQLAHETLDGRAADRVSETECEHGRIEWRELRVAAFDLDTALFPGARQLVSLTRWYREKKSSADFKSETRYFITSLEEGNASHSRLAEIARGHWSVENKNHWKKDAPCGAKTAGCGATPEEPKT